MRQKELKPGKEVTPGSLNWLGSLTYRGLGDLQEDLNQTERGLLIGQLATSLTRYETLILAMPQVRKVLYGLYDARIQSGTATSQFSKKFNMSIKDHNDQIRIQVDTSFKQAYTYERFGNTSQAARSLQECNLSHKVLFSPEVIAIVNSAGGDAPIELMRIKQYQDRLSRSTVKMAAGIARRYSEQLEGSTVEWSDLVQEAIIAAKQAIEAYSPREAGNTFTSFVHTWIRGVLSKKINETVRTVPIPRTTLDRFAYISKAIDELKLSVTDLRGEVWHGGKFERGKVNATVLAEIAARANSLQKNGKLFDAEEVRELVLATQEEVSTDLKVDSGGSKSYMDTAETTLGDLIPSKLPSLEERIDGNHAGKRLMAIIRRFTNDEEYAIMELRYGMGNVQGYQTVSDLYVAGCQRPMNKCKVAQLEGDVIRRVQIEQRTNVRLKKQLRELMATLPFIPKQ